MNKYKKKLVALFFVAILLSTLFFYYYKKNTTFKINDVVKDSLFRHGGYSEVSYNQLYDFIKHFKIENDFLPVEYIFYRVVYPSISDFEPFHFRFETFFILVPRNKLVGREVHILNFNDYIQFLLKKVFKDDFIINNESDFDVVISNLFHMYTCGNALDVVSFKDDFLKFHSIGGDKGFAENIHQSTLEDLINIIKKRCWGAGGYQFNVDGTRSIHLVDVYGAKNNAVIYKILLRPFLDNRDERISIESSEPILQGFL